MKTQEFCEFLMDELREHYHCHKFKFQMTTTSPHSTINTLGSFQPVTIHTGNEYYEVQFRFTQDTDVPLELNMQNVLRNPNNPLGGLLHRYLRSVDCQPCTRYGISAGHLQMDYSIEMMLGSEEQLEALTKDIKDITWKTFSDKFDSEIDDTLKSK